MIKVQHLIPLFSWTFAVSGSAERWIVLLHDTALDYRAFPCVVLLHCFSKNLMLSPYYSSLKKKLLICGDIIASHCFIY